MRSDSAAVSALFNSSSFAVVMFCFSSMPRISCSFWYCTSFSWEVLHLHLQVHELIVKPILGLHGGVEAGLEVVLGVVLISVFTTLAANCLSGLR